jgi:hypothetical protein
LPVLEYDFRVVNANAVNTAFASIERRAAQHNQKMNRMFGTPVSRAGGGSSAGSVPMAARARARAGLSEEEKAAKQTEAYWRRAHQRSADQRIRQEQRAHAAKLRLLAQEEKAGQRAAKTQERAGLQAARAQERAAIQAARAQERAQERAAQSQSRAALRAGRSRERALDRSRSERLGRVRGILGTAGNSVSGTVGAVGTLGGAALGIGGSIALGSAVQTQMSEAAMASQLANQAGDPSLKGGLLKQAQSVKGFTGAEALGGIGEFVTKTGDLKSARDVIGDLGQLALATGSDLGDLGATAGQVFNVLKGQIEDPTERMKELKNIMGALAQQGSLGAVEIRDLAQDFGKLGAATRQFEGGAPNLLRTMGAFAQIAVEKGGASSSADASTAAARLSGDIVTNKKRFAAIGVDVKSKTDKTKLRDPLSIMLDVLDKTGGDIDKTHGLFNEESGKIFKGLGATYSEAESRKKGSGRAAVEAEFKRYAGANLDEKALKERAGSRLEDSDLQFKEAMKRFNAEVGQKLLPTLTALTPKFAEMLPYISRAVELFAKLVDEVSKNPLASIGKLIAAKVAFDIASAQIGGAAKSAITKALAGIKLGGGGGAVPAAAGGAAGAPPAGGIMSAAGAGAAIGISVATAIITAGVVNFEKQEADIAASGADLNAARASKDPEEIRSLREKIEKRRSEINKTGMTESLLAGGMSALSYAGPIGWAARAAGFDEKSADSAARSIVNNTTDQNRETATRSLDTMIEELRKLEAAMESNTKATIAAGGGPNRSNAPGTPSPVKGG